MNRSRQLDVYSKGFGSTSYYVLDSDGQMCLYSLREKRAFWTSGPDIEIVRNSYRPELKDRPVELPVGTVNWHTLSTSLDVYIRNQPVKLSSNGILGCGGMSYVSPGPGARTLSWDREGMFSNSWRLIQQLPGGGRATVARIEAVRLSLSKIGQFEVLDSRTDDNVLDEIIVTGLAVLLENRRRRRYSAVASGA